MASKLKEFKWIKGENDVEYIKLLIEECNRRGAIARDAVAKMEEAENNHTGEETVWTVTAGIHEYYARCAACGYTASTSDQAPFDLFDINYCPNCGKKIRKSRNSNQ